MPVVEKIAGSGVRQSVAVATGAAAQRAARDGRVGALVQVRGPLVPKIFLVKIFCLTFKHTHEIINIVKQQN